MKREVRFSDSLGREIVLLRAPRRIVSLVPSDTYSLVQLGAEGRLIGRTRYCVEPADAVASIPVMGGTKNADVEAIIAAAPDLVLANREENSKRDLERIAQAGVPVFVSFPKRVAEGLAHVARMVRMLDLADDPKAKGRLRLYYDLLRAAETHRARTRPMRAFFPIWMDPLMTIHGDTIISDVMNLVGLGNVFADRERQYPLAADLGKMPPRPAGEVEGRDTRYPRIDWSELVARAPDVVLLPDEAHDFTDADADRFRALDIPAAQRRQRIVRADGKDFSWYGARCIEALPRVAKFVDQLRAS